MNPEEAGEEGEESNEQNEQEEKEKEKEEEEAVFPRSKADIEAAIDSISLMTVKQLKEVCIYRFGLLPYTYQFQL